MFELHCAEWWVWRLFSRLSAEGGRFLRAYLNLSLRLVVPVGFGKACIVRKSIVVQYATYRNVMWKLETFRVHSLRQVHGLLMSLRGMLSCLWSSLNLILMPHTLLTHTLTNETINKMEITILSFPEPLPSPLSQWKCYRMLYSTQTGRDDLLFTSMIDPLFSFYCPWL